MQYIWETPEEIDKKLAERVVNIRKRKKLTGEALAKQSGVSYGSIKRFEQTGQISLKSLTRIALALDCVSEITGLFADIPYGSIEEVINESKK